MKYASDTRHPGRRREEAQEIQRQRYGALNAIGGMGRAGRYVYSGTDSCLRPPLDPIYRGPCPPNPNGTDLTDVYAAFYHEGEVRAQETTPRVTTPQGITFYRLELNTTSLISEEGIVKERTRVLVLDPGVYYVSCEFRIPENDAASGTLALLYDRQIIPAMTTDFNKEAGDPQQTCSMNTLIQVDSDGAELILGVTDTLTLTQPGFAPLITLTLFSIA